MTSSEGGVGLSPSAAAAWGAALVGLAVALGAFGVHTLAPLLPTERLDVWETAVRYQTYHGLGLLALGALRPRTRLAPLLLLAGTFVFSGSLYLLVLSNVSLLGAVTPLGGVLQIAGWAWLAWSLARHGAQAPA